MSVAVILWAPPVAAQVAEPENCRAAELKLPSLLLPSQPQAFQDRSYQHALEEFKLGNLKGAAEELRPLAFASARNAFAVVLQSMGDRDGAMAAFQEALKLWPSSAEIAYNLANVMLQAGRPNAAIFQLQSALHGHPDHDVTTFSLNLLMAEAYRISAKDKLAAEKLEWLLSERPNSPELHSRLAMVDGSLGLLEASASQYRDALRLRPEECFTAMGLSKTLLQMGRASEAIPWLKEYVRLWSRDAEGYYISGRAFADLGQFTEAVAMFSKAVDLSPESYDMRYHLAMALWRTGNREATLPQFEAAERLKPNEVQVHSALARFLWERGDKEQARKEDASVRELISRNQDLDRASVCIGMGDTLLQRGDLKNAEARFREALKLDPQSARARSNLGLVLALLHQPQDGERELQKAIELDPKLAVAYNALGVSYLEEGRVSEAKIAFEQAIHVDPEYAEAKNSLGALYAKSGKNAEAVALFEEATQDSPRYPQPYLNWGLVLAGQGNLSVAKAMFEKALLLSPDLAQARKALQTVGEIQRHKISSFSTPSPTKEADSPHNIPWARSKSKGGGEYVPICEDSAPICSFGKPSSCQQFSHHGVLG